MTSISTYTGALEAILAPQYILDVGTSSVNGLLGSTSPEAASYSLLNGTVGGASLQNPASGFSNLKDFIVNNVPSNGQLLSDLSAVIALANISSGPVSPSAQFLSSYQRL